LSARKSLKPKSPRLSGDLQWAASAEAPEEENGRRLAQGEQEITLEGDADEARKPNIRKARTRELLLTAGREVFADQGFEAPRVQDVARVAGVSRAAFYLHFSSLEELIKAVFAREVHWQLRRYQSLTSEIVQNERKLRGWMERVFASFRQERRYLLIFYRAHSIDPTLLRVVLEQRHEMVLELGTRIPELGIYASDGSVQAERLTEMVHLASRIDDMSTNLAFDSWPGNPDVAIQLIARDFVAFAKSS
jgi:AcrR family transcriptional regulator